MSTRSEDRKVVSNLLLRQASIRVADAATEEALDALVDAWTDGFLDLLRVAKLSDDDIESALEASGLTADAVNSTNPEGVKTAGIGDWILALGGKILKGAWHMIAHPFASAWKLVTSSGYRTKIKTAIKRAVRHEVRSSKHMIKVAMRLAQGEEVRPQEVKAAGIQFIDIASKVLLLVFIGPHIAHMFAAGPLQAIASLMSPADEVAGIMIDKPLRWVTHKFLGEAIGLLPSGFYTHF